MSLAKAMAWHQVQNLTLVQLFPAAAANSSHIDNACCRLYGQEGTSRPMQTGHSSRYVTPTRHQKRRHTACSLGIYLGVLLPAASAIRAGACSGSGAAETGCGLVPSASIAKPAPNSLPWPAGRACCMCAAPGASVGSKASARDPCSSLAGTAAWACKPCRPTPSASPAGGCPRAAACPLAGAAALSDADTATACSPHSPMTSASSVNPGAGTAALSSLLSCPEERPVPGALASPSSGAPAQHSSHISDA